MKPRVPARTVELPSPLPDEIVERYRGRLGFWLSNCNERRSLFHCSKLARCLLSSTSVEDEMNQHQRFDRR